MTGVSTCLSAGVRPGRPDTRKAGVMSQRCYLSVRPPYRGDLPGWSLNIWMLFYCVEDLTDHEVQLLLDCLRSMHPGNGDIPAHEFKAERQPSPEDERVAYLRMRHDWEVFKEKLQNPSFYVAERALLYESAERLVRHIQASRPAGSGESSTGEPQPSAQPDSSRTGGTPEFRCALPTALVAVMALRELIQARYYYPSAIKPQEALSLQEELIGQLEPILDMMGFEAIRKLYRRPDFDDLRADGNLLALQAVLLMRHPDVRTESEDRQLETMEAAVRSCEEAASAPVRQVVCRLQEIMFSDCRAPHPADDTTYQEPARRVQLLREYWARCSRIVQQETASLVFTRPHLLLPIILNIRSRIDSCLEGLLDIEGVSQAKETIDALLDVLVSGEGDDLQAVPEWTHGRLQEVQVFVEQARLQSGAGGHPLTSAEAFFLKTADEAIADYGRRIRKAGERRIERAGLATSDLPMPVEKKEVVDRSTPAEREQGKQRPKRKPGPKGPRCDPKKDKKVFDEWQIWRAIQGKTSIKAYAKEKHGANTRTDFLAIKRAIERERKRRHRKGQK